MSTKPLMELDELLKTRNAKRERGTFHDAVVVPGKWVARFPRTATVPADAPRRRQRRCRHEKGSCTATWHP